MTASHPAGALRRTRAWLRCLLIITLSALLLLSLRLLAPHPAAAIDPLTVIINEVAWGGTAADPSDEWIELYNNTAFTVTLSGWTLSTADLGMQLSLAGTLAPYGHYLIERSADSVVSDIQADLIASFSDGLSNDRESLFLRDPNGEIIDSCNRDGGPWPTGTDGGAPLYLSMERSDPTLPDFDGNWLSNDGSATNGEDALGNPLNATPRAPNSVYLPIFEASADLWVTQDGPEVAVPGTPLLYTLTVLNRGGASAASTWLTDSIEAPTATVCEPSLEPTFQDSDTFVWSLGALPAGGALQVAITCRTPSTVTGILTSTAVARTVTRELYSANNRSAMVTLLPAPAADLLIVKRGPLTLPPTGRAITYTMTLTNQGSAPALAILVTDTLPSSLAYLGQSTSPAVRAVEPADPSDLAWQLSALGTGETVTIAVAARVQDARLGATNMVTASAGTTPTPIVVTATWESARLPGPVLISGVLFDGYQPLDTDEAVQLVNTDILTAALDGWELCKDSSGTLACRALPPVSVGPGQRIWIARDAGAFTCSFGAAPDGVADPWSALANDGDEVLLRDDGHQVVDTVIYGGGALVSGWQGVPVQRYDNGLRGLEGQILYRISDERSGLPSLDTNTAADWIQDPSNPETGRRVLYPGWDLDPLFWPVTTAESATLHIGIAPDNAYELVTQALRWARQAVTIETYVLQHPGIIATLQDLAISGVHVTLLLEGSPVGIGANTQDWQTQLYACATIEALGGECYFMIHRPEDAIYNRYEALHGKVTLIDDAWVIISTQNFSYDGMPSDPKANGSFGSRGVVLVTDAPQIVAHAQQIIRLDLDPAHADILRWGTAYPETYGDYAPDLVNLAQPDWTTATVRFTQPAAISGTMGFELFTAPEAALRHSDALLGLLARAGPGDTVLSEQLYDYADWGTVPITMPNLRVEAYVAAARRGARVRVLLNGMGFVTGDPEPPPENVETVAYLNRIAWEEGLDLRAGLGNPSGSGIHSKLVAVQLAEGGYVHVGSLNGSEAASKVNREVVLQVSSQAAYDVLSRLFIVDWSLAHPVYMPMLLRAYTPPAPPVPYLVFSEVYYASSEKAQEWVEIYNPTLATIDLSVYKVGDAETPDRYEGMYRFPPGTLLMPGEVIVVAGTADAVPQADLEIFDPYNLNPVPNMVRYWGTGEWTLANAADQVLLLGPNDHAVDIVVWGTESYAGVIPHPGVELFTHSLQRYPVIYDTDNCSMDFLDWPIPSPGSISDVLK